jgi:hypothetical protein
MRKYWRGTRKENAGRESSNVELNCSAEITDEYAKKKQLSELL